MIVFRRLCLWLVMLALPLQGLAAASMLYCGGNKVARVATAAHTPDTAHDGQHRHEAGHVHSGHHAANVDMDMGMALAANGADGGSAPADHKCSMCAFCGHAVTLDLFPPTLEFGESAHASPPEPQVLIPALAVLVPDKPPRA